MALIASVIGRGVDSVAVHHVVARVGPQRERRGPGPKHLLHTSKGGVLFLTVSVRQPTGLEALLGVFDKDVEVDPLKVITGGQSQDKNEKFNLALMHNSKDTATKVALEKLGYKVGQKPVGAVISDIDPKVPAFATLTPGDTVVEARGKPVRTAADLVALLRTYRPGQKVSMKIRSVTDGAIRSVQVPTVKRPGAPNRAFLGVSLETLFWFEFPVKVTVNSGDVGGPSAGLAYTLAIIDQLTPGSLTGGKTVAVTGTMQPDGSVGEVGGVHQKTLAAISAGATLMLVPTGEYADALDAAHGRSAWRRRTRSTRHCASSTPSVETAPTSASPGRVYPRGERPEQVSGETAAGHPSAVRSERWFETPVLTARLSIPRSSPTSPSPRRFAALIPLRSGGIWKSSPACCAMGRRERRS